MQTNEFCIQGLHCQGFFEVFRRLTSEKPFWGIHATLDAFIFIRIQTQGEKKKWKNSNNETCKNYFGLMLMVFRPLSFPPSVSAKVGKRG